MNRNQRRAGLALSRLIARALPVSKSHLLGRRGQRRYLSAMSGGEFLIGSETFETQRYFIVGFTRNYLSVSISLPFLISFFISPRHFTSCSSCWDVSPPSSQYRAYDNTPRPKGHARMHHDSRFAPSQLPTLHTTNLTRSKQKFIHVPRFIHRAFDCTLLHYPPHY